MIVCFKEKHEDRYVQGPDLEAICAHVLRDRIADTYGAMYGDFDSADTVSVWYDEDTPLAQEMLDKGRASHYMQQRSRHHEYEGFFVVQVEEIEE